ncbi:MAG: hypothetical protein Q8M29_01935 [Bacteroidota bacterium]|nr:hypothetical protein [Bacteroidota bacterium]
MKKYNGKYKKQISASMMAVLMLVCSSVFSRENIGGAQKLSNIDKVLSGCSAGSAYTELKLNNVRTRILTCGDMWWDLNSNPKYEVPKGSGSYASFAGSLWFGGYVGTDLRVSAMTYRQSGVDFWPGPLDPATRDVDPATCVAYDKHWRFNRAEADEFYTKYALPTKNGDAVDATYSVPAWIKDYPGSAPSQLDRNAGSLYAYLAPFEDVDGDNVYSWEVGDYPRYNVSNTQIEQGQCKRLLFGDETLFWVFNDKGNTHLESGSPNKIGVEIRAQAFEFATGDALNDMTFYNFEIINRSTDILDSTYFAVWVDADLGYYNDDYIGCDVGRGLGYIYNGDNYDQDGQGVIGYKNKLPALGCDFFQGPIADKADGLDNDKDGCTDCTWPIDNETGLKDTLASPISEDSIPETISMSKFMYYNNDFSNIGNPSALKHYYNYMTGSWKNDTRVRYDNAVGTSTVTTKPICDYVFPGKSDLTIGYGVGGTPSNPNTTTTEWTEKTANNSVGDRRFLQSAGKFTLQPGAINTITFGMPFVRTNSDDNFSAIPLLTIADDKAQSLFDNCFKVLDGPDAPDLTIQEMENQFIVYLSNKETSNNYELKRYADIDPTITPIFGAATDRSYRFEGYMVYQLKDETVSASDLYDQNKARLVFQSDKKNGAGLLVNYTLDPTLGLVPKLMNEKAENAGIKNSFVLTEDLFAEGVKKLVNHKTYYFMAVSYAYNNYLTYKEDVAPGIDSTGADAHPSSGDYAGQKKPFLQGRRNIKIYSAVPHNISPEAGGTVVNSYYGYSPMVKRIEGQGNGGNALDLTAATVNSILNSSDSRATVLEYESGRAPITVKVVDPLKVVEGNFVVKVKKAIANFDNTGDTLVMGETTDLDSGKVKPSYKFQVSGTYTDFDGSSVTKTWDADEVVEFGQEFLLIGNNNTPIGISVAVAQTKDPNCNIYTDKTTTNTQLNIGSAEEGELLESSLTFANSSLKWLSAVADVDGETETNWIRSGTVTSGPNNPYNDANVPGSDGKSVFDDPNQIYESVVGGTWAPFRLTAAANLGAAFGSSPAPLTYAPSIGFVSGAQLQWKRLNNYELDARSLSSVDIVFTSDKSKWTRAVVLEMGYYNADNVGTQRKFLPRKQKSVDKNGAAGDSSLLSTDPNDADYISPYGMGWFPGYAINVETGERLNIAFGENSSDGTNNGKDMIWNPTNNEAAFGGMHYIYVFGHNSDGVSGTDPIDVPRYDAGAALIQMLGKPVTTNNTHYLTGYGQATIVEAYKDAMWVNIPLTADGYTPPAGYQVSIPCDAKVKIRVRKPLRFGLTGTWNPSYSVKETQTTTNPSTFIPGTTFLNSINPANLTSDTVSGSQNNNFPMYSFNTVGLGATLNETDVAKSALDLINVVPNPYYGHSQYEKQRVDNYMKIVNLPVKCTIKIYTVNGTLLRTLNKDTDATTDVSWDLKNDKNILISSGLYIIHVDAGELGEKIVKWFCVMRPIDLQSY